jgi:hypothetical protein
MASNWPRSCSCTTRFKFHNNTQIYTIARRERSCSSFALLDSSYYLVRRAVGKNEMGGPPWTLFICFIQPTTTAKHGNVHILDFLVARSFNKLFVVILLPLPPTSVPCFLATSALPQFPFVFQNNECVLYYHASPSLTLVTTPHALLRRNYNHRLTDGESPFWGLV